MDDIFVRFYVNGIDEEKLDRMDRLRDLLHDFDRPDFANISFFRKARLENKKELSRLEKELNVKTVPIKEFLAISPDSLSKAERNLQKVLYLIYNNNEHSEIYHKFPKREQPLLIEYSSRLDDELGRYYPDINKIKLRIDLLNSERLLKTLAHELKHAEQWFDKDKIELNSYQNHQLEVLAEAQAFACGQYVQEKCFNKLSEKKKKMGFEEALINAVFLRKMTNIFEGCMQSKYMIDHLEDFFELGIYSLYKEDLYDKYSGSYRDKGLTDIPDSFGIDKQDKVKILNFLNENIKKKSMTPKGIFIEAFEQEDIPRLNALLRAKRCTGEYFLSDDLFQEVLLVAAFKSKAVFDACQNSDRLTKKDCEEGLFEVTNLMHRYSEKEIDERLQIFNALILLKDKNGKFILSRRKIEETLKMQLENGTNSILNSFIKQAKDCLKKQRPVGKIRKRDDNQKC